MGEARAVPRILTSPADDIAMVASRIGSGQEELLRAIWVATLYAEYRLVLLVLEGRDVEVVGLSQAKATKEAPAWLADTLYVSIYRIDDIGDVLPLEGEVGEVVRSVERAVKTLNHDYFMKAAKMMNELLSVKDVILEITPYKLVSRRLKLTREDAEEIARLGEKIARIMARLGGVAEAELRKLVFNGYREGIVDTIEGLSREEKELIASLLKRPYRRAALIFAYRVIGNYKALLREIVKHMTSQNSYKHITDLPQLPSIDQYL